MRKNYKRFKEVEDGVLSIWVKLLRFPLCVERECHKQKKRIMHIYKEVLLIRAIDDDDNDYQISFISEAVSELYLEPEEYVCVINDIDVVGDEPVAELYFYEEDDYFNGDIELDDISSDYASSRSSQGMQTIEVKMPTSTQNIEFITEQLHRTIKGEPCTLLTIMKHDDAPDYILGFDLASRMSVCYFQSEELEQILKRSTTVLGYFNSKTGEPDDDFFYVKLRLILTEEDVKEEERDIVASKKINLDDLAPQDLRTTSILVYIKYRLPDGELKRLAIKNGNIRSNVVGCDFIKGYHDFEKHIKEGDSVRIVPEPSNPYDKDALAVYWNNRHIGYIPRINIPGVALCMDPSGIDAVVYENNLGWIGIYIEPNLKNLDDTITNSHFGPYSFEVVIDNETISISIEDFKKYFIYTTNNQDKEDTNHNVPLMPYEEQKQEVSVLEKDISNNNTPFSIADFFPVYGITMGKSTWKDVAEAGIEVFSEASGKCWGHFPNYQGAIHDEDNEGVVTSLEFFPQTEKLPIEWMKFCIDSSTSFDEWMNFFQSHGFVITILDAPHMGEYEGRSTFVADVIATSKNRDIEFFLMFANGNKNGEGALSSSKNSLFSLSVSSRSIINETTA